MADGGIPPSGEGDPPGPPPRAFAQGTGVLLQAVGAVLFLSSCCICSSTFLWDPIGSWGLADTSGESADGVEQNGTGDIESAGDEPGKFGLMLMVMFSSVGGLAFMVFGLGMQSEKRRAGWGAAVTNVLLVAVLLVAGVGLWWGLVRGTVSIFTVGWHAIVTLAIAVLLCFTLPALRQVLKYPPPDVLNTVPADYDPKRETED